jgi:DNA polymerase III subunit beta
VKVTIERDDLARALLHVRGIIGREKPDTLLAHALLRVGDDGRWTLAATDGDCEIAVAIPATGEGAILVPAMTLSDIVERLAAGSNLEMVGDDRHRRVTIRSSRSRFNVACHSPYDYEGGFRNEWPHHLTVAAEEFARVIDRVAFAMYPNDLIRYELQGITLHISSDKLHAFASDHGCIAATEMALPPGTPDKPPIILPRKAVPVLCKMLAEPDGELTISLSTNSRIRFDRGDTTLTASLVNAAPMNFDRPIAIAHECEIGVIEVVRKALAEVISRVSVLASNHHGIWLLAGDGRLVVYAPGKEGNFALDEIAARCSGRADFPVNWRSLADALEHIEGDDVRLTITNDGTKTVVRGSVDDGTLHVIVAFRLEPPPDDVRPRQECAAA